jgi:hypothetical protein
MLQGGHSIFKANGLGFRAPQLLVQKKAASQNSLLEGFRVLFELSELGFV